MSLPATVTPTIGEGLLVVTEQKTSGTMDQLYGKRRLMVFNQISSDEDEDMNDVAELAVKMRQSSLLYSATSNHEDAD